MLKQWRSSNENHLPHFFFPFHQLTSLLKWTKTAKGTLESQVRQAQPFKSWLYICTQHLRKFKYMGNLFEKIIHLMYNLFQKFSKIANSNEKEKWHKKMTDHNFQIYFPLLPCAVYSGLLSISQTFPDSSGQSCLSAQNISRESHLSRLTPFPWGPTSNTTSSEKTSTFYLYWSDHSISLMECYQLLLVTYNLILFVSVLSSFLWAISMPFL